MNALTEQEELLIQKKIDNSLTESEQKQIEKLLKKSAYAREFYQNLLTVHSSIVTDEELIPIIDVSDNVMKNIKTNHQSAAKNKIFKLNTYSIISYAALIAFGIIIGSIGTLYKTSDQINENRIAGTMVNHSTNTVFEDNSTLINLQKVSANTLTLNTFYIETTDSLLVRISSNFKSLTAKNISELSDNRSFTLVDQTNNELTYSFSGENIIQIKTDFNEIIIEIVNKDGVLYESKTD